MHVATARHLYSQFLTLDISLFDSRIDDLLLKYPRILGVSEAEEYPMISKRPYTRINRIRVSRYGLDQNIKGKVSSGRI